MLSLSEIEWYNSDQLSPNLEKVKIAKQEDTVR